jgi:hypothetical protein
MPSGLLFLMNIAVLGLLLFAGLGLHWAGPDFAAGCIVGYFLFLGWFRMKHGYWP